MKGYNLSKFDKAYIKSVKQERKASKQIQLPLLMKQIFNKNVARKQMIMINDPSYAMPKNLTRFQRFCSYLQENLPVILPESNFLLFWNILMGLIIIVNFIQIPIDLLVINCVKNTYQQELVYEVVNSIFVALMGIDFLFIRFRVAYYYHEILVIKYQILIRNYIKKNFLIDLFVIIAYIIDISTRGFAAYAKLLFWLKVYTIIKLNKRIQEKLAFHKYSLAFFKFMKIVSFIFVITNINACIYFATDFYYYSQQDFYYQNSYLWLTGSSTVDNMDLIQTFHWYIWYIYAIYWSVQTSATTGYGQMTPRNPQQVFFVNVVMLTTVFIFIVYTDKVIQIIEELQQNSKRQQNFLQNLREYKDNTILDNEMKKNIQNYTQSYAKLQFQEVQALASKLLSKELYTQFTLQIQTQMFSNIRVLKEITHTKSGSKNKFARQIILQVKCQFYPANAQIIQRGETHKLNLYMISEGRASMHNPITEEYKKYTKYDYFGQQYFFFGGKTHSGVVSKSLTKVFCLQRDFFFKTLKKYPQQMQKLKQEIDMVQINKKETNHFDVSCFMDNEYHLTENCPYLQFSRDQLADNKQESKEIKGMDHDRVKYKRGNFRGFKIRNRFLHTVLEIQILKNSQRYFTNDNL